jgi:hypothetical protein
MNESRSLDYDDFQAEKRRRFGDLAARIGARRGVRRRPRDADEILSLIRLDLARWKQRQATGDWRWLDARTVEVRVP